MRNEVLFSPFLLLSLTLCKPSFHCLWCLFIFSSHLQHRMPIEFYRFCFLERVSIVPFIFISIVIMHILHAIYNCAVFWGGNLLFLKAKCWGWEPMRKQKAWMEALSQVKGAIVSEFFLTKSSVPCSYHIFTSVSYL